MPKKKYIKRPFPRKGVDWDKIKRERNERHEISPTQTKASHGQATSCDISERRAKNC